MESEKWNKMLNNEGIDKKKWIKRRISLFEKYCLPSVLNQTNEKFKWIICISPKTDRNNREFLKGVKANSGGIKILEVTHLSTLTKKLEEFIQNDMQGKKDYVITSRLDNDDAVIKTYIDKVQKEFQEQEFGKVRFSRGYQLLSGKDYRVKEVVFPNGPFINLIEETKSGISTVYKKSHNEWDQEGVKNIDKEPRWVQVIHKDNLRNDEYVGITKKSPNLHQYGIEKEIDMSLISYMQNLIYDLKIKLKKKVLEIKKCIKSVM